MIDLSSFFLFAPFIMKSAECEVFVDFDLPLNRMQAALVKLIDRIY